MSTFDLDRTGSEQLRPLVRPEGPTSDPSTMIGLQRLAGNSAVAAAIKSGQIGSDHGQLDIQRLPDEDEAKEDELDGLDEGLDDAGGEEEKSEAEEEAAEIADEEASSPQDLTEADLETLEGELGEDEDGDEKEDEEDLVAG